MAKGKSLKMNNQLRRAFDRWKYVNLAVLTAGKRLHDVGRRAVRRDGGLWGAAFYAEAKKAGSGAIANSGSEFRKGGMGTFGGGWRTNRPTFTP